MREGGGRVKTETTMLFILGIYTCERRIYEVDASVYLARWERTRGRERKHTVAVSRLRGRDRWESNRPLILFRSSL